MSKKKIHLEDLITKIVVSEYTNDIEMVLLCKRDLIDSYRDFGKQLLELADENATVMNHKQSIMDTLEQVVE